MKQRRSGKQMEIRWTGRAETPEVSPAVHRDTACPSCGTESCERLLKECLVAHHRAVRDVDETFGIESVTVERIEK